MSSFNLYDFHFFIHNEDIKPTLHNMVHLFHLCCKTCKSASYSMKWFVSAEPNFLFALLHEGGREDLCEVEVLKYQAYKWD
jgi:hypothetical protein